MAGKRISIGLHLSRLSTVYCKRSVLAPQKSAAFLLSRSYSQNTDPLADFKQLKFKPEPHFNLSVYARLSKAKLASFVLLSTMCGYALAPVPLDLYLLSKVSVGTFLCISSANTINQWIESPYDSQMKRTFDRVIPKGQVSPTHAFTFAILSGVCGGLTLWSINPLCGLLGVGNIILYGIVYTRMKRASVMNTTVGAVVGAVPPLIGYCASTGGLDLVSLLLAGILYAWQFPHFNALSHNLRKDYAKAGYQMLSILSPQKNANSALLYTISLFPITAGFYGLGAASGWFLATGMVLNLGFLVKAIQFYRNCDGKSARGLFFASLVYLPAILALLLVFKEDKQSESQQVL